MIASRSRPCIFRGEGGLAQRIPAAVPAWWKIASVDRDGHCLSNGNIATSSYHTASTSCGRSRDADGVGAPSPAACRVAHLVHRAGCRKRLMIAGTSGRCRQKRRLRASFRVDDRSGHLGACGVAHRQDRTAVHRVLTAAPQTHDIPCKARRRPDCSRRQVWPGQTCRDYPHWLTYNF